MTVIKQAASRITEIASVNINIHDPEQISVGNLVSDEERTFSGVNIYIATAEGSEITLHLYFRGTLHLERAKALRDAIDAIDPTSDVWLINAQQKTAY